MGQLIFEDSKIRFLKTDISEREFNRSNKDPNARPGKQEISIDPLPGEMHHKHITQNFVNAILFGEELIAPGPNGINEVEICNAVHMAAWTGQTVTVPVDSDTFCRMLHENSSKRKRDLAMITSDWHIHTHCSCDSAALKFETLVKDAKERGITDFGVSNHYHTRVNEPDIAASRKEYEATIAAHPELKGHFHFGIEATLVSKWEVDIIKQKLYHELPEYGMLVGGPENAQVIFDTDGEFMEKYKLDYVVAGMHWPMYGQLAQKSMIKEYHRQYMYAATHPSTTILAHYLWFDFSLFRGFYNLNLPNPFADFSVIPLPMLDELKAALLERNTVFEINIPSFIDAPHISDSFKDEYFAWAAELQRSGVSLAIGSDIHSPSMLTRVAYDATEQFLKKYGIDTSKLFCLT